LGKTILLGCYEIPGYGGASTAGYQLFEDLQKDGFEVYYLNIIHPDDGEYFRYVYGENFGNPKTLKKVSNCVLKNKLFGPHPELAECIQRLAPQVHIGIGHLAALLMKQVAPDLPLIFLPSGCDQAQQDILRGKGDFLTLQRHILAGHSPPLIPSGEESEAVELANLIIPHAEAIKLLYQYYYPSHVGKLYEKVVWRGEWIYNAGLRYASLARPFEERDIDLLFLASSWRRSIKNFPLVAKIASHFPDRHIHIVGDGQPPLGTVTQQALIVAREELFALMGRAKTVMCPSLFDAAPGILFEAAAMGCNLIASQNCGNWRICHPGLLVELEERADMFTKIRLSLERPFPDNIDYFVRTHSYKTLMDILAVV